MPNKTIYLRDEDVETWDQARAFSRERLSPIIMEGLRNYVKQQIRVRDTIAAELFNAPYEQLTPLQRRAIDGAICDLTPKRRRNVNLTS